MRHTKTLSWHSSGGLRGLLQPKVQKVLPLRAKASLGISSVRCMLHCRYTVESGEGSAQWRKGGAGSTRQKRGGLQRFVSE